MAQSVFFTCRGPRAREYDHPSNPPTIGGPIRIGRIAWLVLWIPLCTGCITVAGDRLVDVQPEAPPRAPIVEHTVGEFSFHLSGGKLVTSNKMGRLLNDEILGRWQDEGFISGHSYVKAGAFSGRSEYNLTLSGHQEGDSSVVMQFLSGLTLFLVPYWVKTDMDIRYTLEHVPTGRSHEARAADSHTTVVSLFLLPVAPFTQGGRLRTMDRLANHLYEQLHGQGAFQPAPLEETSPEANSEAIESDPDPDPIDPSERLRRLERLRMEGLLKEGEYEKKRGEILDEL